MWTLLRKKQKNNSPIPPAVVNYDNPASTQPLKSRLNDNKRELQNFFAQCSDIVFREFTGKGYRLLLVYLDTMVDKKLINESILHAVKSERLSAEAGGEQLLKQLADKVVENCEVKQLGFFKQALDAILSGDTVVFTESVSTAFAVSSQGYDFRPVEEPLTESVIRGPREGFTENLNTNISLVRRRLKTPDLKFEAYSLGERTNTRVVIAYLKEVANPEILNEAKSRLQRINIDSILESAYIEELIEDTPFTVFPQLEATERPDKVAAGLLEGRIAIIVDGTPFSLLLPTTMFQLLQSSEDYYQRFPSAILIRLIRFGFLNLALLAPAIYVAITTFHPEMLPTPLLISIMAAREGVPFPTAIEVAVIEFTFEALREAGVRLPKPVGQAVSIVGALVIGQAAVEAGFISPATVIVVAVTAISSFCVPNYGFAFAVRILRFTMILLAAILGFYGIVLALLLMQLHLVSLRSFGVPYFAPLAPFNLRDFKDVLLRAPWWNMQNRPRSFWSANRDRQKPDLKPKTPDKDR